jgi:hypothetical protein
MGAQYVWLAWSVLILALWLVVIFLNNGLRKEMLWASIGTAFLGLSEPLFVPSYWNPPSLFNLAQRTGFDIESIIFSFAVGGLAAVLYESIFKVRHIEITKEERRHKRHRLHLLALSSPLVIFIILATVTDWNHIYCAIVAMFLGGITGILCRPDLKKKVWIGGLIFLGLYFIIFLSLVIVFPNYVKNVWNLSHISGILVWGIPLEELLFAFALGLLWSSFYEHIYWLRLAKNTRN